ncbi:MAG: type transport system permease protein [Nocardioidaceae bacterium]|jgi:ABC-type transport system involved in multi-copper enzyme maturation permease subunit|nr:type transport system permease protein [Nocardioidaceae bacterium]
MRRLISIEILKLRTTPALYVSTAIVAVLTVASVISNILLAGRSGAPPLGSVDNVAKVLSVAAVSTVVAMTMGIIVLAGEYRTRTIVGTYLAEARRGRVLVAKLVTITGFSALLGALTFGLGLAVAKVLYSAKGVHHLPVDVPRLWIGAILGTACYGLLGVALGALTRNTVGAIIGGIVWVFVIEVGILQPAFPSVAKWLPTGAAVAITSGGSDAAKFLPPVAAALVLLGWTVVLSGIAARFTLSRAVR